MTESSVSNRILNGVATVNAIYIVNAVALVVALGDFGLNSYNYTSSSYQGSNWLTWWAVRDIGRSTSYGLLLGELACLGLWFSLSVRTLPSKCKIYVWFAIQLIAALTILVWDDAPWASMHYLGIAAITPFLIATGLRWSSSPLRLVELEKQSDVQNKIGITFVQTIWATAAIAFCLVTYDVAAAGILDTYSALLCFIVYWACSCSVLSVGGLMIALQFRRPYVPVVLGFVVIFVVVVIRFYLEDFAIPLNQLVTFVWPALLPMIFAWLAPQFGFVVEPQYSPQPTKERRPILTGTDPFANDSPTELDQR